MSSAIELHPGRPATALAVVAPLVAVTLIAYRAGGVGLAPTADDPVPPWTVAAATLILAAWVSWRAVTQVAVLGPDGLRCRNLSSTFDVSWDDVERLVVVHRAGLVVVEIRFRHLRRSHRLGAATRFPGADAGAVVDLLRAHPRAAGLLSDGPRG